MSLSVADSAACALRNSRRALPNARPTSGNLPGPKTMSPTIKITMNSPAPMPNIKILPPIKISSPLYHARQLVQIFFRKIFGTPIRHPSPKPITRPPMDGRPPAYDDVMRRCRLGGPFLCYFLLDQQKKVDLNANAVSNDRHRHHPPLSTVTRFLSRQRGRPWTGGRRHTTT